MADIYSREKRSEMMAAVRSVDTRPELRIRRVLHRRGFRYRIHANDLPGRPDIVLQKHKAIVQVRGCFWHAHGCPRGQPPKSNLDYWQPKLDRTKERDKINDGLLRDSGWRVFVIWECEIKNEKGINNSVDKVAGNLESARNHRRNVCESKRYWDIGIQYPP